MVPLGVPPFIPHFGGGPEKESVVGVPGSPESLDTTLRFSPEAKDYILRRGYPLYELTGRSVFQLVNENPQLVHINLGYHYLQYPDKVENLVPASCFSTTRPTEIAIPLRNCDLDIVGKSKFWERSRILRNLYSEALEGRNEISRKICRNRDINVCIAEINQITEAFLIHYKATERFPIGKNFYLSVPALTKFYDGQDFSTRTVLTFNATWKGSFKILQTMGISSFNKREKNMGDDIVFLDGSAVVVPFLFPKE